MSYYSYIFYPFFSGALNVYFKKHGGHIAKFTNKAVAPIGYMLKCYAPCTMKGATTAPHNPNS